MKKIGIITAGGDCPGLNTLLYHLVRYNSEFSAIGFTQGWKGLIENKFVPLDQSSTFLHASHGGTFLQSSKTFPLDKPEYLTSISKTFSSHTLDGLIVVGGESTLDVAHRLFDQLQLPIIGIPKTIDNDVHQSEVSLGFWTAVDVVSNALDQLRNTAQSHSRLIVAEIMGRYTGWLAAYGGSAGMADLILVPEKKVELSSLYEKLNNWPKSYGVIAAAEGITLIDQNNNEISSFKKSDPDHPDQFPRFGGIVEHIKEKIRENTSWDVRTSVLGHIQRGANPNAKDRILAEQFAHKAHEMLQKNEFGKMVVIKDGRIAIDTLQSKNSKPKGILKDSYSTHLLNINF